MRKWSEIKRLSKATDADRSEARAELAEEMAAHAEASSAVTKVEFAAPWKDQLALVPAIGHTVAELLPPGFARYVRVFHPFVPWTAHPEEAVSRRNCGRWADIARDAGVTFGPTLTWRQLEKTLPVGDNGQRPYAVWEGDLELGTADALFAALPNQAVDGYFFAFGLVAIIRTDAHVPVTYFVRSLEYRNAVIQAVNGGDAKSITTAEYVWPTDNSWIICTDYDLTSTYVALGIDAASRLLATPEIEAVEVALDTRVDDAADEQNSSFDPSK